ncbi:MAG: hypothetical protein WAV20_25960 [Blastocatellia bacterium]
MKLTSRLGALGLLTLLITGAGFSQEKASQPRRDPAQQALRDRELEKKALRPPTGPSFYVAPIEGSSPLFSVLLTDGSGRSVSGSYTSNQIDIFEAVLEAAKAFAFTDEKVGAGEPITTRFMEQHEWSLFVDVSKMGKQSLFYVSLISPTGRLTAEAGEIIRGSKKEPSALLLKMLSQVQEARVAAAAKSRE